MMHLLISKLRVSGIFLLVLILGACNTISDSLNFDKASTETQPSGSFVWHDLITHDIDRARAFYSGLFGWEFEQAEPRQGNPYILAKLNGRYAGGIVQLQRPTDGSSNSRWLGYMTVDNIDTALAATSSQGGAVIETARDIGEIGKVAAIEDSQSAVLGLIETDLNAASYTPDSDQWCSRLG